VGGGMGVVLGGDSFDHDMEEEMRAHLELEEEENRRNGMAEGAARSAARKQFGNAAVLKETSRAAWRWRRWDELARDVRYALRTLRRSPGFAAVAIATVALCVAANIAVFTVIYKVVLRPVEYRDVGRLMDVHLILTEQRRGTIPMTWSYPKFLELVRFNRSFDALAAFQDHDLKLSGIASPEQVTGETVSAQYFRTIGVQAQIGRVFVDEEDNPASAPVVLISDALWRSAFGQDAGVLGKVVRVDDLPMTVAGVMPPGFKGESGRAEMWQPMGAYLRDDPNPGRLSHNLQAIGLRKPGVSPRQADVDVRQLVAQMERQIPTDPSSGDKWSGGARPLLEARVDPALRRSLWILQGATLCVLLIGCVNLANLMLGRGTARRREVAIRLALGTRRGALMRQMLVEPVLLALGGGTVGLFLAGWGLRLVASVIPVERGSNLDDYTRFIDPGTFRVELPFMILGLLLALATGILFGLLPAWQASRANVSEGLHGGMKAGGPRNIRLRNALVVTQMALALVLLAGADLMIRSFSALLATRVGADTHGIVTLSVQPSSADQTARRAFFLELERRAAALPGVEAAALTNGLPAYGPDWGTSLHVEGREEPVDTGDFCVSPGFFRLFRVPMVAGRPFDERDGVDSPLEVVISEAAARRFFPGQNPLGRHMEYPQTDGRQAEVVGVAGDVKFGPPRAKDRPVTYTSVLQSRVGGYLTVRTGNPRALTGALRNLARTLDAGAPVYGVRTMDEIVAAGTWRERLGAMLLGVMASLSLVLAAVGIYGVFSYAVAARTRDFGVRIALGANRGTILTMVVRECATLAGIALLIGLPTALALSRLLASQLFHVSVANPLSYATTAALLVAVAFLACMLPARRATRIDPMVALRSE
jgi:putative ABC transport system permease protein